MSLHFLQRLPVAGHWSSLCTLFNLVHICLWTRGTCTQSQAPLLLRLCIPPFWPLTRNSFYFTAWRFFTWDFTNSELRDISTDFLASNLADRSIKLLTLVLRQKESSSDQNMPPKSVPSSANNRRASSDFSNFCSSTVGRGSFMVMWL